MPAILKCPRFLVNVLLYKPVLQVWEQVKPHLRTNDAGVACYKDVPFTVPGKGVCTSRKLFKAPIC